MNLVRHRFQSPKVDGADPTQIQPSAWNDGHVFSGGSAGDLLTRDPTDATYGAKWAPPVAPPPGLPAGGNLGDLLTKDPSVATFASRWAPPPQGLPGGGNNGDVLTKDSTVAGFASKWAASPAAAHGLFQTNPFNAADFSTGGAGGPMTIALGAGNVSTSRYSIIGKLLVWNFMCQGVTLGGTPSSAVNIRLPAGLLVPAWMYGGCGGAGYDGAGQWTPEAIYWDASTAVVSVKRADGAVWALGASWQARFTVVGEFA